MSMTTEKLRIFAKLLHIEPRLGSEMDVPEGSRYITISQSAVDLMEGILRSAADDMDTLESKLRAFLGKPDLWVGGVGFINEVDAAERYLGIRPSVKERLEEYWSNQSSSQGGGK